MHIEKRTYIYKNAYSECSISCFSRLSKRAELRFQLDLCWTSEKAIATYRRASSTVWGQTSEKGFSEVLPPVFLKVLRAHMILTAMFLRNGMLGPLIFGNSRIAGTYPQLQLWFLLQKPYPSLRKVRTWMQDDLCWVSIYLWFRVGGWLDGCVPTSDFYCGHL